MIVTKDTRCLLCGKAPQRVGITKVEPATADDQEQRDYWLAKAEEARQSPATFTKSIKYAEKAETYARTGNDHECRHLGIPRLSLVRTRRIFLDEYNGSRWTGVEGVYAFCTDQCAIAYAHRMAEVCAQMGFTLKDFETEGEHA